MHRLLRIVKRIDDLLHRGNDRSTFLVHVSRDQPGHALDVVQRINCHHNHTEREHHRGHNVWLTRKGAIRAREGDLGVIPGSMGTRSYIVRGLGNPASYHSCSHGAGRRMSRGQARRQLDEAGLVAAMAGKAWNGDARALLDEDPRAYKDVDQVTADQQDLVAVEHTLTQVLNYKGT
jgi:tRNA-splicing ligase RtcB (3'-phosphate/5'-hydroxy nucleic acid ligase)